MFQSLPNEAYVGVDVGMALIGSSSRTQFRRLQAAGLMPPIERTGVHILGLRVGKLRECLRSAASSAPDPTTAITD